MITTDEIKQIEAEQKAANEAFAKRIEQVKAKSKLIEKFTALVAESNCANASEFLAFIGVVTAPAQSPKGTKVAKTPKTKGPSDLKKGPPSADEKALIVSLHSAGKDKTQIAAQLKRSEDFVDKYLKK